MGVKIRGRGLFSRLWARCGTLMIALGFAFIPGRARASQKPVEKPTLTIDQRVENVRRSLEGRDPNEAGEKLIEAQWYNWPNWPNWNQWSNWPNWPNWFNF